MNPHDILVKTVVENIMHAPDKFAAIEPNIQILAKDMATWDDKSFADGLVNLRNQLADSVPEFTKNNDLTADIRKEIAQTINATDYLDTIKRDILIENLTDFHKMLKGKQKNNPKM